MGWLNTKMYLATGDEQKSQGWTALVLDTNGDGKRGAYTEPGQPQDPAKDMRVRAGFYAVAIDPNDNSVWGSFIGYPGGVVVPLSSFDPHAIPDPAGKLVVFACRSGKRSVTASIGAQAAGLAYDKHLAGGMLGWKAAGLPTRTGG